MAVSPMGGLMELQWDIHDRAMGHHHGYPYPLILLIALTLTLKPFHGTAMEARESSWRQCHGFIMTAPWQFIGAMTVQHGSAMIALHKPIAVPWE